MLLLLRLFANCENEQQAVKIANSVIASLSAFAPVQSEAPARYWKIPAYFEFCFALSPATKAIFLTLLATHNSEQWLQIGDENDSSAIWNRSPEHCFLLPEIAWAELIFSSQ